MSACRTISCLRVVLSRSGDIYGRTRGPEIVRQQPFEDHDTAIPAELLLCTQGHISAVRLDQSPKCPLCLGHAVCVICVYDKGQRERGERGMENVCHPVERARVCNSDPCPRRNTNKPVPGPSVSVPGPVTLRQGLPSPSPPPPLPSHTTTVAT